MAVFLTANELIIKLSYNFSISLSSYMMIKILLTPTVILAHNFRKLRRIVPTFAWAKEVLDKQF
jgi:hypothetical protein